MGDTGGNSLTENLNTQYQAADMVWVAISGCLVFLMIPGIAMFYAGLSRKKHSVTLIWEGFAVMALITFQWFFWGYSFVFSHEAGKFWGKIDNFSMMKVLAAPSVGSSAVPDIVFMFFQGMFACTTAIILLGGAHERARLGPLLVFIFIEITVVYCPIAEWTWNPEGWLAKLGALDLAGGGPVHIASGCAALAYALICGKRRDPAVLDKIPQYKPGSMLLVAIGTTLIWFGWFGFNAGSPGAANLRAFYALANTNLSAACGALTWLFLDWFKTRKWTMVGMCSGALAGLVGITPAAGFVPIYTAVAIGAVTAVCCNLAGYLKNLLRIDDGLDVFALHGVGGMVGSICTGLFAADYISHLDGALTSGGWMTHHWVQLPYQLAAIGATVGWSFVITAIVLVIMNYIPYMKLRMSEEDEMQGSDMAQLAEYGMLYELSSNHTADVFAVGTHSRFTGYDDAFQLNKSKEGDAPGEGSVKKLNSGDQEDDIISAETGVPDQISAPEPARV
nr:Mep2.1 [Starmerella bombicola]